MDYNMCRNPLLQNMFRFIGFGEKAGSGADIIAKGWEENHWARPTIKDSYFPSEETELILDLLKEGDQGTTQTTTQKSGQKGGQKSGQKSGQTTEQVLELIKANPNITRAELSSALDISPSAIQKHIDKLKGTRIRRVGGDKGGHWEIIDK
ncbi:MAG: winged helix-turn-helix transcriptional regulator [Paludibacteraceae bacterium]|nr:winged helix-turn-helix transcriptional regulator [Paludibacteraceae bacterium]